MPIIVEKVIVATKMGIWKNVIRFNIRYDSIRRYRGTIVSKKLEQKLCLFSENYSNLKFYEKIPVSSFVKRFAVSENVEKKKEN